MTGEHGLLGFLHALHAHRGTGSGRHGGVAAAEGRAAHQLFQVSTLNALMAGVYDGTTSIAELRRHGDFGVGTFNALDGELVADAGEFYQLRADGSVRPVPDDMKTPFAVVQWFRPAASQGVSTRLDIAGLKDRVHELGGSDNYFFAVRLEGRFAALSLRAVPKQEKPYPPLVEAAAHQSEFGFEAIAGTMVGFRFPDFAAGVNMPGLHMHFVDATRTRGGHVLDFVLESGTLDVDHTTEFYLELPDVAEFGDVDLTAERAAEIRSVEGVEQ